MFEKNKKTSDTSPDAPNNILKLREKKERNPLFRIFSNTQILCALVMLTGGCQLPYTNRIISRQDALTEFLNREGENQLLERNTDNITLIESNSLSQSDDDQEERENNCDISHYSEDIPSRIPQQSRQYSVTDEYFNQSPITAEVLNSHILLQENKGELLERMGPIAFLSNLYEDLRIVDHQQNINLQDFLNEAKEIVSQNYERESQKTRLEKIQKIFEILGDVNRIFQVDNGELTLEPNEWGLCISMDISDLINDTQSSLENLNEESINKVLFFLLIDEYINSVDAEYRAGSLDLRDILKTEHRTYDCNTIASLKSCLAIECNQSQNVRFHQSLYAQVKGQQSGHGYLSIELNDRNGESWNWILSTDLNIPSRSFSRIMETEHEISYGSEGIGGDLQLLYSGLEEHAFRNFWYQTVPLLHFWEGIKLTCEINTRQAALAYDLLIENCISSPNRTHVTGNSSLMLPIVLRNRELGPIIHALEPERCGQVQNQIFRHTGFTLYDIPTEE